MYGFPITASTGWHGKVSNRNSFAWQRRMVQFYDLNENGGNVAIAAASIQYKLSAYSMKSTVTPGLTSFASSKASKFVNRTQPWLSVLPILDGSGVP